MVVESDSKLEGDEDINLDAPLPPHVITFEIDVNIDITLLALHNIVAMDHPVNQSAALQTATRSCSIQEKILAQPDWDW